MQKNQDAHRICQQNCVSSDNSRHTSHRHIGIATEPLSVGPKPNRDPTPDPTVAATPVWLASMATGPYAPESPIVGLDVACAIVCEFTPIWSPAFAAAPIVSGPCGRLPCKIEGA